eukprot:scaffold2615_cov151-Skeletonema_menzelii.AAC.8
MSSKRSLLAGLWSLVGLLSAAGFVVAFSFAVASQKYDPNYSNGNYYNNNNNNEREEDDRNHNKYGVITVTSRAMVFAAIWTAILSGILVIYGTVLLGVRVPFGKYYSCCTGSVHRMTPLTLGSFAGTFAGLLFYFSNSLLEESVADVLHGDAPIIGVRSSSEMDHGVGYIGNRFDVVGRRAYGGKVLNNAHHHEVF